MIIKATQTQLIDVDINEQTAHEVTINYLKENPEKLLNIVKVIFLKKHGLTSRATYNTTNDYWEVYEDYGSHYSGYEKVENQPPKEETEAFQETVARLYALFGTSLS